MDHKERLDLKQKARIKWAIEGDENTNFFHSLVKHKRRRNNLKGLICDGSWMVDPVVIQDLVVNHFADRFKNPFQSDPLSTALLLRSFRRMTL